MALSSKLTRPSQKQLKAITFLLSMKMNLVFERMEEWPALSWLAICERGANQVLIFHGQQIETAEFWFCEAVWDGSYAEANFDQTDLVYGSGGRCRDQSIRFVSSGTTVDRLHVLERESFILISNSLVGLLSVSDSHPDPRIRGYIELFSSINRGITHCDHQIPLTRGHLQLVYFQNLEWDGCNLQKVPKVKFSW